MAEQASGTAESAAFDQYVSQLSDEATQALEEVMDTVQAAEEAATETYDVVEPVVNALRQLAQGDRAAAVQAAMVFFSDEMSKHIAEARAACLAMLAEAESTRDELMDVIDMLAASAAAAVEELKEFDLSQALKDLF